MRFCWNATNFIFLKMKTKIWADSSRSCLHIFRRLAKLHCRQNTTHAQPFTHTHTYTSTAADNQLSCCATSTHSVYLPKLVCAWVSVCVLSDEWKFAASCRRSKKFFFVFPLFFLVLIFDIFSLAAKQQTNWQTAGRFHRCNWVNIEGNKTAMQMQGQKRLKKKESKERETIKYLTDCSSKQNEMRSAFSQFVCSLFNPVPATSPPPTPMPSVRLGICNSSIWYCGRKPF